MSLTQERWSVAELRRASAVMKRYRGLHGTPSDLVRTLSGDAVNPVPRQNHDMGRENDGEVKRPVNTNHSPKAV